MRYPDAEPPEMLDLVFDLHGTELPADHRHALWQALRDTLPWLDDVPEAGVHAIRAPQTTYGVALLPRRAKLVLRLPESRADSARSLEGATIEVAGHALKLGASHPRTLPEAATLYADFVTTGSAEETRFQADIARELAHLQTPCRFICGRRRTARAGDSVLAGFAVVLHDVPLEQSRLLQRAGLGAERRLGCGILIQHKAITGLH